MSFFGFPAASVALLGAAVFAVVIFMYTVRWRLPRLRVSTTAFWLGASTRRRGSGRLGALDHLMSLLLHLLIAAALVGAVARPRLGFQSERGRAVMIVLDRSASMGAIESIESRLEIAKRRVKDRVALAPVGDSVGLILAGGDPEIALPLASDPTPLRRAVDAASLRAAPGRLADAVALACHQLHGHTPAALVVVSDGSEAIGECGDAALEVISVGKVRSNVGITAFRAAVAPRDRQHVEVFVEVSNAAPSRARTELRLDLDGSLLEVVPIDLAAGAREHRVFASVPLTGNGRLVAHLTKIHFYDRDEGGAELPRKEVDALSEDDVAYAVVARRATVAVRLVGDSAPLRLVLAANPQYHVSPQPTLGAVNVIVGNVPAPLEPGRYLLINPRGTAPFQIGPIVRDPRITYWRDEHPILRQVELSDVVIEQATSVKLPASATPLAGSEETPLLFAMVDGPTRIVGLTFELEGSNLPLRVAFPVLIYNAIEWLAQTPESGGERTMRIGEPVDVTSPSGRRRRLEPLGGSIEVAPDAPGFYEVTATDGRPLQTFAVSVADPGETAIAPAEAASPPTVIAAASAGRIFDRELAPWLLVLALALSLIEWITFHRRKTV